MKIRNGFYDILFLTWKNLKMEMVLILVSIAFTTFNVISTDVLSSIHTKLSFECIVEFSSVLIGVYIMVIMIMAKSFISTIPKILKHNLDNSISAMFTFGIIENTFLIMFSIVNELFNGDVTLLVFLGLFLSSIATFIKIVFVIMKLFACNTDNMATELDEQERHKETIVNLLADIKYEINKSEIRRRNETQ